MTAGMAKLSEGPAWNALAAHYANIRELHLRRFFADDPSRESKTEPSLNHDSSTNNLIRRYQKSAGLRS